MAVPMSCMISDASEQTSETQVKHTGGKIHKHDEAGGFEEKAPLSVKAWSPLA